MAHTHIKKTPAFGGLAIGYKTTPEAFREALAASESATTEIEDMTDAEIRSLASRGELHIATSVDALRRSGRGELAAEIDAAYGEKAAEDEVIESPDEPEVEPDEAEAEAAAEDEDLDELSDVEPSGSGSADESEESVESSPEAPDSSDSEDSADSDGVLVQKLAGGWYELEDGSKVRKADLPDGAVIIAED